MGVKEWWKKHEETLIVRFNSDDGPIRFEGNAEEVCMELTAVFAEEGMKRGLEELKEPESL